MNNAKAQAETIIEQLGGNKMHVMIGVKSVTWGEVENANGTPCVDVTVKFSAKASNKANGFTVRYVVGADEYNVQFFPLRGLNLTIREQLFGVHAEELVRTVEKTTGLRLSL